MPAAERAEQAERIFLRVLAQHQQACAVGKRKAGGDARKEL
jgi:hypothetical protein